MSAWHRDPISGEPVLLAPGRAERPHDTVRRPNGLPRPCPFCAGAESETPLESYAERPEGGAPNTPGWTVRVVPNKYPAIGEGEGVHEVVVPTPRHVVTLGALTPDELSGAMRIWALRLARVGRDERGLWPFCFVNEGAAAGASLQHSHAQVVGLPAAPPRMVAREAAFAGGANPIRDDLREAGERLVVEADGLVAWCPEVPPFTGTVRIAPREPAPDLDGADFGAAATLLLDVLARIGAALGEPALNLLVHQRRAGRTDPYHWHMDVIPRLGTLAGLELGTGVVAIAQAPVGIAQRLRGAPG